MSVNFKKILCTLAKGNTRNTPHGSHVTFSNNIINDVKYLKDTLCY